MNTNTDEEGTCWESWCFRASSQSLGVVYNPLADMCILSALFDLLPWVEASWFWKSLYTGGEHLDGRATVLPFKSSGTSFSASRYPLTDFNTVLPTSVGEKTRARSGASETGRSVMFT